jgi:lactate dehydrogenase-like 2-hydroxyacid dehydrogenase
MKSKIKFDDLCDGRMFKATLLLAIAATASGFQLGSSFTPRMGGVSTQARAGRSVGPTMAAVPCGINGFGRIGRLVARIMIKVNCLDVIFLSCA